MDIKLNFINQSTDTNNSQVVIFQRSAVWPDAPVVAWKTFPAAEPQQITIPPGYTASVTDAWGNEPRHPLDAPPGSVLRMYADASGPQFGPADQNGPENTLTIRNDLPRGSLHARILRDGQLVAIARNVVPGQQAIFRFQPHLWIALLPEAAPGQLLPPPTPTSPATALNLAGIVSADLVLRGSSPAASFYL